MGAGQIGGIATLLDIDFRNAAGFLGENPEVTEAQHIVHFLSHAMMFCTGSLIEAHVVLTAATCVLGERYKFEVIGGTHRFLEYTGISRQVHHLCLHKANPGVHRGIVIREAKSSVHEDFEVGGIRNVYLRLYFAGYNYSSNKYEDCTATNLALLVLSKQFQFNEREYGTDYVLNRLRYGGPFPIDSLYNDESCRYYGWGSRRNGFLIPLLINLRRMKAVVLPREKCLQMFNYDDKYLCIQQHPCKSEKFGALCPDDVGSILECSGVARGIMTSRLVDRPCGVGFLDLSKFTKFLMCGVDDSRDVVDHDPEMAMEFTSRAPPPTPEIVTVQANETVDIQNEEPVAPEPT